MKTMNKTNITRPAQTMGQNWVKLSVCLLVLVLFLGLELVNGQFFTKSSKSIPRMGRRSLPDFANSMEAYQQMLADDYEQSDALSRFGIDAPDSGGGGGSGSEASNYDEDADVGRQLAVDRNRKLINLIRTNGGALDQVADKYSSKLRGNGAARSRIGQLLSSDYFYGKTK